MDDVAICVTLRGRFLLLIAALAAGALALTMLTIGQAETGDIFGSDHDTGSPGNPTCAQCHTPHKAGGLYLWARVPAPGFTGESELLPLCFSCHDGSAAQSGSYIPYAAHNHSIEDIDADYDDDGVIDGPITDHPSYETDCKKCMEPDCVRCHDAHSRAWVFLDMDRFDAIDTDGDGMVDTNTMNASLCVQCHQGWTFGVESYDGNNNPILHTTHPELTTEPNRADGIDLPSDRSWDGDASDFSGTRLWSDDTVYSSTWGAPDTALYVVDSGPGDIRCMTCHTPHGGQSEELTALATSDETTSRWPICDNCHR